MVKLILSTDMARHKELIEQFQKCLKSDFDFKNKEHREIVKINKIYSYLKPLNNSSRVKVSYTFPALVLGQSSFSTQTKWMVSSEPIN